jgi:hypothetical protein
LSGHPTGSRAASTLFLRGSRRVCSR